METIVRKTFVNKQHTVAIFFNFKKAYDTTWKYGIMTELFDAGLRGRLPIFIENFLKDRQFLVRLGTHLSTFFDQKKVYFKTSFSQLHFFAL